MIRVLVADDQALIRGALRMLLEHEEDVELAGDAADGQDAVALARETRPDVVLMDISMPGVDGIEATRLIAADDELDEVRVLILTSYESDEHVFEALRAGASGFLLKETEPAELVRGIRVVAGGEALLAPSVTRRLVAEFAARPSGGQPSPDQLRWLTRREREVVALVATGLSNEEIAEYLVISPATAKTHVSRAMRKVHAHDRAQLVVLAYESGLIAPGTRQALLTDGPPLRPRLHAVGEAA
jgi:DNA-binding NarL/FixJ family response regulator